MRLGLCHLGLFVLVNSGGSVVDTVIRGSQVMHYQAAGVCVMSGFTVI